MYAVIVLKTFNEDNFAVHINCDYSYRYRNHYEISICCPHCVLLLTLIVWNPNPGSCGQLKCQSVSPPSPLPLAAGLGQGYLWTGSCTRSGKPSTRRTGRSWRRRWPPSAPPGCCCPGPCRCTLGQTIVEDSCINLLRVLTSASKRSIWSKSESS